MGNYMLELFLGRVNFLELLVGGFYYLWTEPCQLFPPVLSLYAGLS